MTIHREPDSELETNYRRVVAQVRVACERASRNPEEICLIAVSKTHSVEKIRSLYDLGHRHFGESRLQEAEPKLDALPQDISWHFIGHLQSNKAKKVATRFGTVHTVSSLGQLREMVKAGRVIDAFIEVNLTEEPQKSGVHKKNIDEIHQAVIQSGQVNFLGLMIIGPNTEDQELIRNCFREARELNEKLGGQWLSMGMTSDFELAIQEGATHLRIGSAIFGSR